MILVALIVVALLIKVLIGQSYLLKQRLTLSAIPQAPLDSWSMGHKTTIDKAKQDNKFLDLFIDWVDQYGTTVLFWLKVQPFVFTAEPVILKQISTDLVGFSKVQNLPNRTLFGQKLTGYDSILSGKGLSWALKRKLMSRFFAKNNIEDIFKVCKPHMENSQLTRLKSLARGNNQIELHLQLSIIFSSYLQVLGLEKFRPPEVIADDVYRILDFIPRQNVLKIKTMFDTDKPKMVQLVKNIRGELIELLSARLQEMEADPDKELSPTDLVGHVIQANYSSDGKNRNEYSTIVDRSVDDMMTILLVMDNMVKQLASMFIFLDEYPDIQHTLFQELRDKPITDFKSINNLKYTEKCLLESLRMGPALLRGTREFKPTSNRRFGPYVVQSRIIRVHFSEYVMHYNKNHWVNPHTFDPERWTDGFSPEPFQYMPFFVGSRGCLGKHMAMMMMKLTLSVLAQNFTLVQTFDKKNPPVISQNYAVMRIKNNIDCILEPYST